MQNGAAETHKYEPSPRASSCRDEAWPVFENALNSTRLKLGIAMNWFFGRVPAEAAPGDRILPLHFFENSLLVQGNNMAVSLVFEAVLDPSILRSSLEGLVKREGWQRLGGRLRKNVWL